MSLEVSSSQSELPLIPVIASQLSGPALEALAEFYSERDRQEQRFQSLKTANPGLDEDAQLSMEAFGEDWNASQFWVGYKNSQKAHFDDVQSH